MLHDLLKDIGQDSAVRYSRLGEDAAKEAFSQRKKQLKQAVQTRKRSSSVIGAQHKSISTAPSAMTPTRTGQVVKIDLMSRKPQLQRNKTPTRVVIDLQNVPLSSLRSAADRSRSVRRVGENKQTPQTELRRDGQWRGQCRQRRDSQPRTPVAERAPLVSKVLPPTGNLPKGHWWGTQQKALKSPAVKTTHHFAEAEDYSIVYPPTPTAVEHSLASWANIQSQSPLIQPTPLKSPLPELEAEDPPRPTSETSVPDFESDDVPRCESPVLDLEERYSKLSDFLSELARKTDYV
jgi:hypothetical protein